MNAAGLLAALGRAAGAHGLAVAAADLPAADPPAADPPADQPWRGARAVALLRADGPRMWEAFRAAPEWADGAPDPLDRWSARIVAELAARFGARAAGPSDGPPHPPFLRWALLAEPAWPSALGMLVHAQEGLWASWRGALLFDAPLGAPPARRGARPCDDCARPCLRACPVGAFGAGGYDAEACARHVAGPEGGACRAGGCLARRACPVGRARAPGAEQAAFHMAAFLRARAPMR
ncbi:hypothetical protein [Oceanicella actignis]|uniref:4Fe-4S ferredoxin-type domain-containing protein n=1 Tax=Oceanicella actignis TaxID=1189325 RepID=A0A1M7SNY9_9RHOB|nr:hypothetical protein [Oceanicella actignis]SES64841.1 hypothetical protein SAMN04488119_10129 [Oceanicella actignis]SHN60134.1 hypothetical protein SAMN05216200_10330 [Oceanicella actignis]